MWDCGGVKVSGSVSEWMDGAREGGGMRLIGNLGLCVRSRWEKMSLWVDVVMMQCTYIYIYIFICLHVYICTYMATT